VYYPDVYLQFNMFPGVFLPIIRSSMTAVAASGFTFVSYPDDGQENARKQVEL